MNGILVMNKEKGYTSHDVVAKVRKILNIKKVGHTGTLDPNATGVLPLLIGKGTQLSKYLIEHDKIYKATIKLGKTTDTLDCEGKFIEKRNIYRDLLSKENVEDVLKSFLGKQTQIPPIYSAIKVNGKKLYEYARSGQDVEIKPRNIEIYDIVLDDIREDEIDFTVHVSKGTYIRTLCSDIAKKLNTVGYMKELQRIKVGIFNIDKSITIDEMQDLSIAQIENKIISIEDFFANKKKIILDNKQLNMFLNGVKLKFEKENDIYKIYDKNNSFIGTGVLEKNFLKRDIIM